MAEWYSLADLRTRILDAGGPFFEAIPSGRLTMIVTARSCARSSAMA
jgi:hypothetical protein